MMVELSALIDGKCLLASTKLRVVADGYPVDGDNWNGSNNDLIVVVTRGLVLFIGLTYPWLDRLSLYLNYL